MNPFADGINNASTFIVKNINARKTIKVMGINIPPGLTYNLMDLPGVTEDDIKVSLTRGVLKRKINSGDLQVITSDLNLETSNATQNSFLVSSSVVAGAVEITATTIAQAKTLNFQNKNNGMLVYIESVRSYFKLDNKNTLTADNIVIVQVTGGYLIRLPIACPSWQSQLTWYIDPANSTALASDENDGYTNTHPLLTWEELYRRLGAEYGAKLATSNFTVNILSSGANIVGNFVSDSGSAVVFTVNGSYTYAVTDTVAAITPGVASTNTRASVQSTATSFTSYTQKIIEGVCTGGIGLSYAVVTKDLGSNTANITQWITRATATSLIGQATSAAPIVGAAIRIITPVTVSKLSIMTKGQVQILFNTLDFQSVSTLYISHSSAIVFNACMFAGATINAFSTPRGPITFISNVWTGNNTQTQVIIGGALTIYGGCSFRNFLVQSTGMGTQPAQSTAFEFQNAGFALGNSASNNTCCYWQTFALSGSNGGGLGVWDYAGNNAITNRFRSVLSVGTAILYGSGNGTGYAATSGAVMYYPLASPPTITGTTELSFNGSASAIPPLTAGAVVPNTSPLTTWANLAASPFSGSVTNTTNGTSIFSY